MHTPPPRVSSKKPSLLFTAISAAILFTFASGDASAAKVTVHGAVSINNQPLAVEPAEEVSFGQLGDVVLVDYESTKDNLYVYDGRLTINGSSIDVQGGESALRVQKPNSQVFIGSAESDHLKLSGNLYGVYATGSVTDGSSTSKTVLDAKEILIESLQNVANTNTPIGISAIKEADVIVGEHAERIYVYSTQENERGSDQHIGIRADSGSTVALGGSGTAWLEVKTGNHAGTATALQAVSSTDQTSSITLTGSNIQLGALAERQAIGAYAGTNGVVSIGSAASSITINAVNTEEADPDALAFGVWVDNTADLKKAGGQMTLTGTSINISAEGATNARGIHVGSNDLNPVERAKLVIAADNINISASFREEVGHASGISAMSAGEVEVTGNATITAEQAILTRGNASIVINKDGEHSTQITGDIVFDYNASSGTGVDANVDITLAGANSFLKGQSKVTGNPPVDKAEVEHFAMAIRDGGSWHVTGDSFVNTATLSAGGSILLQESADTFTADVMSLDDGVIGTSGSNQTVHVEKLTLTEAGGRFIAAASQESDGSLKTATLTTDQLESTGASTPSMSVEYSGITADELTSSNVKDLNGVAIEGVSTTEKVAEGNLVGEWIRRTDAEGNTLSEGFAKNTKLESFKGANAVALVQWRNQVNHLTKRLGDVRQNEGSIGAWARVYGGESKWGGRNSVDMTSTTVQAGADAKTGDWIIGGAFSYTSSDVDLQNGSGDGDMYDFALYGTKRFESGAYLDFTARYGYIQNDLSAGNMDVDVDSHAFGVSAEAGHQFRFLKDAYVEPQIEVAYGVASGDDVRASNGVKIEQDTFQSLVARVGFRTGFDFPENAGTIYAHASYAYDFLGDADGTASADGRSVSLDEDLGGGWVTYGIGAQFKIGRSAFAYGELERTSGGDVRNPYMFNAGCRWMF